MRSIRISDESYEFLVQSAKETKRTIVSTLDFLIEIFKEGRIEDTMAKESLPDGKERTR